MKTTKHLLLPLIAICLLFNITIGDAQAKEPVAPEYVAVTTMHWNMDLEDFDMKTWKAVEKEYLEKVTMKNEHIMSSSIYLHNMTPDNTELIYVQAFATWDDMGKFGKRNAELEKEAWPDENDRKAFFKNRNAYYSHEHSDEIYAPIPGAKRMIEKPSKDMIAYVRKSHFAFPEDGSREEFMTLKQEGFDAIINKNEHIKAYYPNVHAWGSDRTEYTEVFYLDTLADLENMFNRNQELAKEAWPDDDARKAKQKTVGKYFTGVHGDYVYTWLHELSK